MNSFTDSHYTPLQFAIEGNFCSYTLGLFFEPVLKESERKMNEKTAYNANQEQITFVRFRQ